MDKKKIPIFIAIILGLTMTITSFYFIKLKPQKKVETMTVYVPSVTINPFEEINGVDLTTKEIEKGANTDQYYITREDLIGKVAKESLSEKTMVNKEYVTTKESVKNIRFMAIKTDYTRTGGAKPGDIVNIYKVQSNQGQLQGQVISSSEGILIAEDVTIISITDSEGTSIYEKKSDSTIPLSTKKPTIQAVKIAYDANKVDTNKLVEGAVNAANGYVFVVKTSS